MSEIVTGRAKSGKRFPAARFLVYLNCLFWILLFALVWIRVVPFADRKPDFEEELPAFKFGAWAIPVEMENGNLLKAMRFLQLPSYWTSVYAINYINQDGTWEYRVAALSIGAYVLIATMFLSMAQWYAMGILLSKAITLLKRKFFSGRKTQMQLR